jgi:hypothetical protein
LPGKPPLPASQFWLSDVVDDSALFAQVEMPLSRQKYVLDASWSE